MASGRKALLCFLVASKEGSPKPDCTSYTLGTTTGPLDNLHKAVHHEFGHADRRIKPPGEDLCQSPATRPKTTMPRMIKPDMLSRRGNVQSCRLPSARAAQAPRGENCCNAASLPSSPDSLLMLVPVAAWVPWAVRMPSIMMAALKLYAVIHACCTSSV